MIILGGGVVKHHVCNANLMRNGADFSVMPSNRSKDGNKMIWPLGYFIKAPKVSLFYPE